MPRIKMSQDDLFKIGVRWFYKRTTSNMDGLTGQAYFIRNVLSLSQRMAIRTMKNTSIRRVAMPLQNSKESETITIVILYNKCLPKKTE